MTDCIERNAALEALKAYGKRNLDNGRKTLDTVDDIALLEKEIDAVPTAAVAPVVHGAWIRDDETQALLGVDWHCSKCGLIIHVDGILTAKGDGWHYCPNCGAKMDGEDDNGE